MRKTGSRSLPSQDSLANLNATDGEGWSQDGSRE